LKQQSPHPTRSDGFEIGSDKEQEEQEKEFMAKIEAEKKVGADGKVQA
jgi:hypothetical protein